jgi:alkanesulfonate monooxygenase SsuD/methylene tetrahydromethanopterin reductase-like flavin-dependent oxidoreductase (luciferase family)
MHIDIQLSPAVEEWPALRDGVLLAEERGFDTTWVFDHFDGAMLFGTTMLECFSLLGALAACTERIRLGSLVVNVANRRPGVTAQSAASIQMLSSGRFTLGLGAGAAPGTRWSAEHAALHIDLHAKMAERHRRVEDTLDEIHRLWRPDRSPELATFALPAPPPPVVLGVNSVALAELAGRRCDGINVSGNHERIGELLSAAHAAREAAGRSALPWDCSVWTMWDDALFDPDHPDRRRWASLGVTRLILVFLTPHDHEALARAVPHP